MLARVLSVMNWDQTVVWQLQTITKLPWIGSSRFFRGRKMSTNLFCTNFLSSPKAPGHAGKIPGTSQVPPFVRQTFDGGQELFDHPPFAWKTTTPPDSLRIPKTYFLCSFFLPDSRDSRTRIRWHQSIPTPVHISNTWSWRPSKWCFL